jgi:nucleoside-diphosphate-sugar epimerase
VTRVLVTGGGGFVGRQVVPHLRDSGLEVWAPSRTEADLLVPGMPTALAEAADADVLVHLAWEAAPGYATSPANTAWLLASLELATAFVAAGGRRIVAAGSCAELDLERPTPYADCKRALHLGLRALAATRAFQLAWARLFFLYGPGEHPERLVASLAASLAAGRPALASAGRQRRDYLDVRDAGAAVAALATSGATGLFDVASGDAPAVADIARALATAADRTGLLRLGALPAPDEAALIVGDPAALRAATGWHPQITLADGLRDAVAAAERNRSAQHHAGSAA